jgi:hypothetical protein
MDNETKYSVVDLINFAHEQKPIDFEQAFGSLIGDKLSDAINNKKLELASSLVNNNDEEEEQDYETDESDFDDSEE